MLRRLLAVAADDDDADEEDVDDEDDGNGIIGIITGPAMLFLLAAPRLGPDATVGDMPP
jgi:hypothetical protein